MKKLNSKITKAVMEEFIDELIKVSPLSASAADDVKGSDKPVERFRELTEANRRNSEEMAVEVPLEDFMGAFMMSFSIMLPERFDGIDYGKVHEKVKSRLESLLGSSSFVLEREYGVAISLYDEYEGSFFEMFYSLLESIPLLRELEDCHGGYGPEMDYQANMFLDSQQTILKRKYDHLSLRALTVSTFVSVTMFLAIPNTMNMIRGCMHKGGNASLRQRMYRYDLIDSEEYFSLIEKLNTKK